MQFPSVHDGTLGFLRDGTTVANLLSLYDPWDGGYYPEEQTFRCNGRQIEVHLHRATCASAA